MLRVIDMFAGIGGFSLGLHRTGGFETVAVAELDPYASKVLALRFPGVPNVGDVTTAEYPDADFICAGFPCQDISFAGNGAGLAGERSGLWREVVRAIRVVRPRGTLLENVAALLGRGLDTVLGDLAEVGHDAEWHCIPAAAVGAPHRRDRIWIATHARGEQHEGSRAPLSGSIAAQLSRANAAGERCGEAGQLRHNEPEERLAGLGEAIPHAAGIGRKQGSANPGGCCSGSGAEQGAGPGRGSWWAIEPNVGRVAHGLSTELDIIGRIENAETNGAEAIAAPQDAIRRVLLYVWQHRETAKASPELYRDGLRDCLPAMPCRDTQSGMLLGPRVEKDQGLCGLWAALHAAPFDEAQDLQRDLLVRARAFERSEKVAGLRRVDRLRCLGNAVVPQIPELIGNAILASLSERKAAA